MLFRSGVLNDFDGDFDSQLIVSNVSADTAVTTIGQVEEDALTATWTLTAGEVLLVDIETFVGAEIPLTTTENETVFIDVLGNDSDVDLTDTLIINSVVQSESGGEVVIASDGTGLYFDPLSDFDYLAEGETTTVTFTYTVDDQQGFDGTDGENESSDRKSVV